jgi:hypothetical protein
MKITISKATLFKIVKILKWGKLLAKLAAIGTTISGAVTALSGSATTGMALSAAGATTYAAAKTLPTKGYEKTRHIPPGRVDKAANLLRQQEIVKGKKGMNSGTRPGTMTTAKTLPGRSALGMGSSAFIARKK